MIERGGVPLLLVRGRVSDLVSEAKAEQFLRKHPSVQFTDVSGAGHMVAGDRNDAFTDAVVRLPQRCASAGCGSSVSWTSRLRQPHALAAGQQQWGREQQHAGGAERDAGAGQGGQNAPQHGRRRDRQVGA